MAPKGEGSKIKKKERKDAAKRLREVLAERPLELHEMMAILSAQEDLVLAALRELGEKKRSRLRSGMVEGRPCWWWEKKADRPKAKNPSGARRTEIPANDQPAVQGE